MPTLRQYEYVIAVADTGQFVEAARVCAVSQPALSKQVQLVEELLGVQLFERARPQVIVTPAGEEVVRRARLLLAQAGDLVAAAREFGGEPAGTVRLGVIPTIAPYGLPGLLARLRERYPLVSFAIRELQTEVLLQHLRAGSIDIGLLARPFDDHQLTGPDLVVEPFVLIAPTGHPLCVSAEVSAGDIVGASLILMEDGHCLRDQAMDVCAVAGRPPPTSVTAGSISTLVRMVESGLGATLLPASAIATEVRPGQGFVVRGFGGVSPGRTLTLQWRSTSPRGPWFAEVGEVLTEHYIHLNKSCPAIAGPRPLIRAIV